MAKIAFLGLGQMGSAMAARLLQAGHDVTVWNRTREKAKPIVEKGAVAASSPAEAATGAEIVITMVATPQALEEVVFADDGLGAALQPGQIFIDMSTVGPATIGDVAAKLPSGVSFLDAPVRGSVPQATGGTLAVFVGADDDVFERVRPILETFGTVRHVGGVGSGAALKLVVNLTLGLAIVALGEALVLGRSFALDPGMLLDVLEESPIGPTVKSKRPNIEAGHYPPNFKLVLSEKDIKLVDDAAAASDLDLRTARAAHTWFEEAAPLYPDLDYSAVVATILGEKPLP
jgi:3-hydroxyisobutyrate dehydrogenase-like beta-hydroxyacid dehydrogenase